MKTLGKTLLAATAAVAIAGIGGLALAKDQNFHTMTIRLADGSTAKIEYTGDVPPKVTIGPAPLNVGFLMPFTPFDMLNAISAQMNRQMDWLFHHTAPLHGDDMLNIDLHNIPEGMRAYSVVSTMTPGGMCMRQTEIVNTGHGEPKVVSRSSGDCGAAPTADGHSFGNAESDWPKLHTVNYTTQG